MSLQSVRYKDGETYRDVVKLSSWHDVQRLDTYKKTAEFIYNFFKWKKDDRKESEEEEEEDEEEEEEEEGGVHTASV